MSRLPKAPFAHHVDQATQQLLQLSSHGRAFEKGEAGKGLHQEVEVALIVGLAPSDGADRRRTFRTPYFAAVARIPSRRAFRASSSFIDDPMDHEKSQQFRRQTR